MGKKLQLDELGQLGQNVSLPKILHPKTGKHTQFVKCFWGVNKKIAKSIHGDHGSNLFNKNTTRNLNK